METTFYQPFFFFFVEVFRGWNFVCWINIGMITDNSFIIPWLSSLDFQVIINIKAKFMIFLINILNVQVSIITSKSKLPILFLFLFFVFSGSFPRGFKTLNQTIILVLSFSQKNFLKFIFTHMVLIGWNLVPPPSL